MLRLLLLYLSTVSTVSVAWGAASPPLPTMYMTIDPTGRLANQLFEIASTTAIATQANAIFCYQPSEWTLFLDAVRLTKTLLTCPPNTGFVLVRESGFAVYDTNLLLPPRFNTRLTMNLQSYKYFDNYTLPFELKRKEWAAQWVRERNILAAVHVRRTDYTTWMDHYGGTPENSYYEQAIQLVTRKKNISASQFVVCSDDTEWVKQQPVFAGMAVFSDSPGTDLAVISACPYVVVSIGTYGWWGAYLASKEFGRDAFVVAHHSTAHQFSLSSFNPQDYYPPSWHWV